jgi:hypothetical protein
LELWQNNATRCPFSERAQGNFDHWKRMVKKHHPALFHNNSNHTNTLAMSVGFEVHCCPHPIANLIFAIQFIELTQKRKI